ncbi:MAG TPA: transglycosylase domain-containing protein [Candidatus Limnocylindrales bacterium]|nr:transglycosylase domain-containing protein [Candidatus Limnocylindrales bacterium]
MQTSLARRRRVQRALNGRRSRGGRTARTVAIAFPLFLFSAFLVLGTVGFVTAVAAYNHYAAGLEDPKALLADLSFSQQTVVLDRTGKIELARLGEERREVVGYDEIPPEVIDATTAIEDKTFWDNPGFDPLGIVGAAVDTLQGRERGASTITQQLVRARLLPPSAFEGSRYERKIKEIIQSIRLTQALPPGVEGKKQIIAAYLNQNFYGNLSYGIKAAAKGYFGVDDLHDLTLAQAAILAGIPQSPSKFDLIRNAVQECQVEVAEGEECPADQVRLVVPPDREIVRRRNYILELMKTRSPLSGDRYTEADYERAKREPVVLTPPPAARWRAPHFVWQVRKQLGALLCGPDLAEACEKVDTGGYRVVTTLDWRMQAIAEKWVYVAARAPNSNKTDEILTARKIPRSAWGWIRNLRDRNIHNAAAAVLDARTGEVLVYVGSAGYYLKGSEKLQPQFDVLADGWRQPGSAIKPIDYAIGIEDRTMTAATLFMDVVTNFAPKGQKPFTPTQADGYERGPVRLRSALQFSLNIPAIKAGLINGLEHQFARTKDFGLVYPPGAIPVVSMSIGTLEVHPIDLLSAYAAIADGGVLRERSYIREVYDDRGRLVWPAEEERPAGRRVISPQAAYVITDILAGNTDPRQNPYWAEWAIREGDTRRPAAYKTGTTSDNRDVHAYGYLAPPEDPEAPQLVAGVWMGNSNNEPNNGSLSLDSSAPLWSAILTEISKGLPMADFQRPEGIVEATIDANSGFRPGPFTTRTIKEVFIEGTVPQQEDFTKVPIEIDAASGLLWQEGCAGPPETRGFLDLSRIEASFPEWQAANEGWIARARRGIGVAGGPEKTRTIYFYNRSFAPFGRGWGAPFPPTETCTPLPPSPSPIVCDPFGILCPSLSPDASLPPSPEPEPRPGREPKPSKPPR